MAAEKFKGVLAGPEADPVAIAQDVDLFHLSPSGVGQTNVHTANGFGFIRTGRSPSRSSQTRDPDPKRSACAGADARGKSFGDFGRDGAVRIDKLLRYVGEESLELLGIDDRPAQKGAGCMGNGSEPLREQAAGAALGGGEGLLAAAEKIENDLFKGLPRRGKNGIAEFGLHAGGECGDAGFGFRLGRLGTKEMKLDLC